MRTDSILSRARLARNNINILSITDQGKLIYEFQYRLPTTHAPVWHKTLTTIITGKDWADQILDEVRELRRELEHGDN